MFAFMIRRATTPGGAEREETALHVPPIHAAHPTVGYLLNWEQLLVSVTEFLSHLSRSATARGGHAACNYSPHTSGVLESGGTW